MKDSSAVARALENRLTLQLAPLSAPTGGLTPKQLAFRRTGIGASEVAAVLGLDIYRKPYDVWRDKMGLSEPETEPSVAALRGQALEPLVAQLYAEAHPGIVITPATTLAHPDHACILATPDRFAEHEGERFLVEIKTKTWRTGKEFGTVGTDEVPDNVQLQVQQQLLVTGLKRCDVAVLIDDSFRVYTIHANPEIQAALLEQIPAWWERHVIGEVPPALDGSDAATLHLRATLKQATREMVPGTDADVEIMTRFADAKARAKAAEAEAEVLIQQMMLRTGENGGIHTPAGKFTWLEQKGRTTTDWKTIATELGATKELIAKRTITAEAIRVCRFTPAKA